MGPIRAFIRPSHAAAPEHSATTASLFCPTQSFPTQHHHRPCCSHTPSSYAPQHHHLHHHHLHHHLHNPTRHPLYATSATSDPLRIGLVPSSPQPILYHHFRKLLPPGAAALANPLPVLTTLSQAHGEEGLRAVAEEEGKGKNILGRGGGGDGGGGGQSAFRWRGKESIYSRLTEQKEHDPRDRKVAGEIEWKKGNSGQSKWKASSAISSGSKSDPVTHGSHWKKSQDEAEGKGSDEGHGSRKNTNGRDEGSKNRKEKTTPVMACLSSLPAAKHDEPLSSTSRVALVFPFSEDEEEEGDEDGGDEGTVPGDGGRRSTWLISDIVETEDEEGEIQQKLIGAVKEEDGNIGQKENRKEPEEKRLQEVIVSGTGTILIEGKGEEPQGLAKGNGKNGKDNETRDGQKRGSVSVLQDLKESSSREPNHLVSVVIKNPHIRVPEGVVANSNNAPETGKDNRDPGHKTSNDSSHANLGVDVLDKHPKKNGDSSQVFQVNHDDAADRLENSSKEDGDEKDNETEEEEEEMEGEPGTGDIHIKDGVRSTQRLRPRSYRQFLLTRERRSRVFLKERSYRLGRWFVTHFTHPYPSKEQKDMLATKTKMTRNQVSEWFGNMRRRIREATRGRGICWEERVRIYNSVITGKSEPLPILPEDDINTWVPPVAQDPPAVDLHEEVSASPKFKTTLLHRYLNHSETGDYHIMEGSVTASGFANVTSSAPIPGAREFQGSVQEGPSCSYNIQESSQFPSSSFPHIIPLRTSSPKENIKELWNTSFEHIKDNYRPFGSPRSVLKDHKTKQGNTLSTDEGKKVVRKFDEILHSSEVDIPTAKRPRITMPPAAEWLQKPSTSKLIGDGGVGGRGSPSEPVKGKTYARAHVVSSSKVPLPCWGIRRPVIEHSRNLEEDAAGGRNMRQPEELAAAYTLMQLQHTRTASQAP